MRLVDRDHSTVNYNNIIDIITWFSLNYINFVWYSDEWYK
jgi:hypothetical protein